MTEKQTPEQAAEDAAYSYLNWWDDQPDALPSAQVRDAFLAGAKWERDRAVLVTDRGITGEVEERLLNILENAQRRYEKAPDSHNAGALLIAGMVADALGMLEKVRARFEKEKA